MAHHLEILVLVLSLPSADVRTSRDAQFCERTGYDTTSEDPQRLHQLVSLGMIVCRDGDFAFEFSQCCVALLNRYPSQAASPLEVPR